ncbi:MAG TPA: glutaminase, partial [Rhabdaerophilum sp.]|nr:glutaminase [Rhabdaerophilum sp.]
MTLNPLTGSEFSLSVLLDDIREHVLPAFGRGKVADYIPELAHVDPRKFAMTVVTVDGEEVSTGNADEPFSLQSITKLLALILALNRGGDEIWSRVGREPTGTPFNHLAILEAENGVPRNPFVNAGALAVTDYLLGSTPDIARLMAGFIRASGAIQGGGVNESVAASERTTGDSDDRPPLVRDPFAGRRTSERAEAAETNAAGEAAGNGST